MTIVLFSVLMIFTTFTTAEVQFETNGSYFRQHSLDGMASDEHVLFLADVSSDVSCAAACLENKCCTSFSTSPKDLKTTTCRGYDSWSVSQSSTSYLPGSKTFFRENKLPAEASLWLEGTCVENSDCPSSVSHVLCFAGQCLCQPGYYYSHCRDACVPDCPQQDLQPNFLAYPGRYITGNNIPGAIVYSCTSMEMGKAACLQNPSCRTFDINSNDAFCYLQAVAALDDPHAFMTALSVNAVHYQRTCL